MIDIAKAEARKQECSKRYKDTHSEAEVRAQKYALETHLYRLYLREYWLSMNIDPTPMLALSDKELEAYVVGQPLLEKYLQLADGYEINTGGLGKYMNADCAIDWPAVACTAWYFANNKMELQAAYDGNYSSLDNLALAECPARLASEQGPQDAEKANTTSNTMTYVAVGIGAVAVVGIAALLLRGK